MKTKSPIPSSGQPSVHKSMGPRTLQGKKRSRFNALKHGVYSKFVPLEGEPIAEYRLLLNGLWDYWHPQGTMESVEVENLAAAYWHKRRLFQSENAMISENIAYMESDSFVSRRVEAWEGARAASASGGLLKRLDDPLFVREANKTYKLLRLSLIEEGFIENCHLIKRLYGVDQDGGFPDWIPVMYESYARLAELLKKQGDQSVEPELRKRMVEMIDQEIESLTKMEKQLEDAVHGRFLYKWLAAVIPGQGTMELVMRYETHLSREIDRIVNRLVRLQRMRKGQPLPPQLDVKIS
jgi:hypothetical protein